jgi:general stress protein 26
MMDKTIGGQESVDRLLAAATDVMAKVTNCWLVTMGRDGRPNARIVSPISGVSGDDEWRVWFLISNSSRKAADIHTDSRVLLGYQYDPDSAYVVLAGQAFIMEERSEISRRWSSAWDLVFPVGSEDMDAVFLKVEVECIELWNLAHKVTPAPFGKCAAMLARSVEGDWTITKA